MVFFAFALLANLIGAPFNGLLASAVERRLRAGKAGNLVESGFSWAALGKEFGTSIRSELRKLAYFLPRAIGLLLLYLIPVVNIAAAVFLAGFQLVDAGAWLPGLSDGQSRSGFQSPAASDPPVAPDQPRIRGNGLGRIAHTTGESFCDARRGGRCDPHVGRPGVGFQPSGHRST